MKNSLRTKIYTSLFRILAREIKVIHYSFLSTDHSGSVEQSEAQTWEILRNFSQNIVKIKLNIQNSK